MSDTFERDEREELEGAQQESGAANDAPPAQAQEQAEILNQSEGGEGEQAEASPEPESPAAREEPSSRRCSFPALIFPILRKLLPASQAREERVQSDNPDAIEDIPMEDEDLPILEDDAPQDKGKIYNFVAKMDDVQFRRAQAIFGAIIGLVAGLSLYIPIPGADGGSSMWNFVIALVIAMWVPRFVERKIEKKIPVAQKWMLILFVLTMAGMFAYGSLTGNGIGVVTASPSPSPSAAPTPSPAP